MESSRSNSCAACRRVRKKFPASFFKCADDYGRSSFLANFAAGKFHAALNGEFGGFDGALRSFQKEAVEGSDSYINIGSLRCGDAPLEGLTCGLLKDFLS